MVDEKEAVIQSTEAESRSDAQYVFNDQLSPAECLEVEKALGHTFAEQTWLVRALTHRSVLRFGNKTDYERLEFLGDAVLDLVVADLLLKQHPDLREGDLSKMRAALVNTESLAQIARSISLGSYIRMSKGERASGAQDRSSILADVTEALVGAVYRDAGYEVASGCVARLLGDRVCTVTPRDPKTELQEKLHALGWGVPIYKLEGVEGPEHAPTFISIVEIRGESYGRGRGSSKKSSHQAAAEEALTYLDREELEVRPSIEGSVANQKDAVNVKGDHHDD